MLEGGRKGRREGRKDRERVRERGVIGDWKEEESEELSDGD